MAWCGTRAYGVRMRSASAKLWIKIEVPGLGRLGPGKIQLLKAVAEHQSIAAAARAMGMSYRKAWGLIDDLNTLIGAPVVETRSGGNDRGGAVLTEAGAALVEAYDEILKKADTATSTEMDTLVQLLRGKA